MTATYDLVVVGAGIVGLAHALAARRRGLSVAIVDREAEAIGASVRNFGFVTVTGQQAGRCWSRAMRSRDVWEEVAPRAGIAIEHQGLLVAARRPEAMAVLEAFQATEMGADCALLTASELRRDHGAILSDAPFEGALWSPHERRVESRHAIPQTCGVAGNRDGGRLSSSYPGEGGGTRPCGNDRRHRAREAHRGLSGR